jgi:hypothetical protein
VPEVVLDHDLRHGNGEPMTTITTQDGKIVFRDGRVGTGQECCCETETPCVCPQMDSLCIAIELVRFDGNTVNLTQDDFFWFGNFGGASSDEYSIFINCSVVDGEGGITVTGGWADVPEGCNCTSGSGSATIPCSDEPDWYAGTVSANIEYDDCGVPLEGCPATLGSFTCTISDPPC